MSSPISPHLLARADSSRHRFGRRWALALLAVLPALSMTACTGSARSPEVQAAQAFLSALAGGQLARAAAATDDPSAARTALAASGTGLGTSARAAFHVVSSATNGKHATVRFTARWTFTSVASPWTYPSQLVLDRKDSHWMVHWSPTIEHPSLTSGTHLALRRVQPARGALLDNAGQPLFHPTPVVTVGLEPKLIRDLATLARQLAAVPALQSSAAEIEAAVRGAAPTDFVPIITLRRPAYEAIRSRIHSLPGTVFQTGTEQLTRSSQFGQPLLGHVGPATAQLAAASHGRIAPDEQTGLGGLQQAYDTVLSGTPGVQVGIVDDDTGQMTTVLRTLAHPQDGRPVRLTLATRVQQAADDALAHVAKPAAIVAIQPSTGRILADANSAAATYDLGLQGELPPGSTFKIATWVAAFSNDHALSPSTLVACPATRVVDGRVFINENRFSHPPIPISASFGYSCNTSAINVAMSLPAAALGSAARQLGVGGSWSLPVPAYSGDVPTPTGQTEQAADAIGQGRVLVSPLLMALMTGAAATGHVWAPTIDQSTRPQASRPDLADSLVRDMRTLMRSTVDLPGGTAHVLSSVPGLMGKTGTAEYGNARPPRTHTWFVGVHGDLAFAVFIYDGATNGGSALPVVARFLAGTG